MNDNHHFEVRTPSLEATGRRSWPARKIFEALNETEIQNVLVEMSRFIGHANWFELYPSQRALYIKSWHAKDSAALYDVIFILKRRIGHGLIFWQAPENAGAINSVWNVVKRREQGMPRRSVSKTALNTLRRPVDRQLSYVTAQTTYEKSGSYRFLLVGQDAPVDIKSYLGIEYNWLIDLVIDNRLEESNLDLRELGIDRDENTTSSAPASTSSRLPDQPPKIWEGRARGRPKKGEADPLIEFIREVYGRYFPEFADKLKAYIYRNDPNLYQAIATYERRRALPDDIVMPSQRTLAQDRFNRAMAGDYENLVPEERASVRKKIWRAAKINKIKP